MRESKVKVKSSDPTEGGRKTGTDRSLIVSEDHEKGEKETGVTMCEIGFLVRPR